MMGFGLIGSLFPVMFLLIFGLALFMVISTIVSRARENRKNDASPRLTVPASVVAKRAQVGGTRHHDAATHTGYTSYNTRYFATFQFESGDRLELAVSDRDYGMLVEGDRGSLSFQGTRFLDFRRA